MGRRDGPPPIIESSGGGKIVAVVRRMKNKPKNTDKSQWLGSKRRPRSVGMIILRKTPTYTEPTPQQQKIGGVGAKCGARLKGKLAGKDWATIKKAMAACVLMEHNKEVPDEWKKVYLDIVGE